MAIALAARQVNDHALGRRIAAYEGLYYCAQFEHRAVILDQPRAHAADHHVTASSLARARPRNSAMNNANSPRTSYQTTTFLTLSLSASCFEI
ncbi:MAG: hypothetical protein EOR00_31680 [Mesorhizobium sp.]|uniref:hypothetical protein n=1 Tax=Mesorhizobium sp. TaxID=1871066 RepID=UPI000FE5B52B|nr:hypothetical protein [Mesorhizobium sp.]RWP09908.1 MAG: hypothetical protein EOR00_31680 [Mesorhizobium sp.]